MDFVLVFGIRLPVADGPAAGYLARLVEPAVQDAEVEHSVDASLHTASAAGFLAAPWIAEPEVHALNHLARHIHIVVFHKNQVLHQLGIS